ncbi:MAG: hypothetical protein AMJ59_12700 [Gammaproteobacteria bacterium SG8_31]|nr:MAG: hypothetical protein AMJ59_12700 [Gammaproteobacteria bacterium SG8_31]
MIPARAIVDPLRDPTAIGMGSFRVEVWGDEPNDFVRVYTIDAMSDTLAAQEGLRRFSDEIELLLSKEG